MIRSLPFALLLSIAPAWAADVPPPPPPTSPTLVFPRIASAGGVVVLPKGIELPAPATTHRLLIDATSAGTTASGINNHLEAAARAVNLYALAAVPPENVKIAVVVHGKATPMILSAAAYQRHAGKPSADAALIAELHDAGVMFYVCGQSLVRSGHAPTDVHEDVTVALSAMTKLVELQADGYGLIP
ncbi:MAG: DsrE family protein [Pseudoxanthomonas sp.]